MLTLAINKATIRLVVINQQGYASDSAKEGVPLMIDRLDTFRLAPTNHSTGIDVVKLPESCLIPDPRINRMVCGAVKGFRHQIGFSSPDSSPDDVKIAVWMDFKEGVPKSHEFLVGGGYKRK